MSTRWNFGTPTKGAPRIRPKDVKIKADGQTWTASWTVEDDRLIVSSAYGSRSEAVGNHPAERAAELLEEIVNGRIR